MAETDNTFVQKDAGLSAKFLQSVNELRIANSYCDVILKVGCETLPAHRLVLAANAPYFRAMFADGATFIESRTQEIVLHGVELNGVKSVVEYFYTSEVEITSLNFEAIFTVANMWSVEFVLKACENFLRAELTPGNSLGFQILVHQSSVFSDKFRTLLDDYVNKNFMDICEQEEFLAIPKDHLEMLLKSDAICVKSENLLCDAVLRWLSRETEERSRHGYDILSALRLGLVNIEYLQTKLLDNAGIGNSPICMELINTAIAYLHGNTSVNLPGSHTRKRQTMALYIHGGFLNGTNPIQKAKPASAYLEFLDFHGQTWEEFPETFLAEAGSFFHRTLYSDNYIYVIGKKMLRFSIETLNWENINNETNSVAVLDIRNCQLCAHSGVIYAIGGASNAKKLYPENLKYQVTQEEFSLEELSSEHSCGSIAVPTVEHYRPGLCILRDSIYVLGGCDRTFCEAHGVTERLDLSEPGAQWNIVSDMPTYRWGLGAAVLNDQIFAVGGYDTEERGPVNTVEVYTPLKDTWQSIAPLNSPRRRFGIATVNGSIFVVGGCDVDSVEYYESFSQKWVIIEGLSANRYDSSCFPMPLPQCL